MALISTEGTKAVLQFRFDAIRHIWVESEENIRNSV